MIVSHEHRFIFLKTRKTAGTSVEVALSDVCGPRDVITPIRAADEDLRSARPGPGAQNYRYPVSRYTARNWASFVLRGKRREAYNHMAAAEVRRLVGARVWADYAKLTIVRNPWDAVVSAYFWRYRHEHRPPVAEFLRSELIGPLVRNVEIFTIDGAVVADHVCRFENLAGDLEKFRLATGLPEPLDLPRAKGETRSDRRHYRDILDDDDAATIAHLFREEISLFDYRF